MYVFECLGLCTKMLTAIFCIEGKTIYIYLFVHYYILQILYAAIVPCFLKSEAYLKHMQLYIN